MQLEPLSTVAFSQPSVVIHVAALMQAPIMNSGTRLAWRVDFAHAYSIN